MRQFFRISKLIDQICDGLRPLGFLKAIRAFPELFVHLFTYTASISPADLLEAVYVDGDEDTLSASNAKTLCHLRNFLSESPQEG